MSNCRIVILCVVSYLYGWLWNSYIFTFVQSRSEYSSYVAGRALPRSGILSLFVFSNQDSFFTCRLFLLKHRWWREDGSFGVFFGNVLRHEKDRERRNYSFYRFLYVNACMGSVLLYFLQNYTFFDNLTKKVYDCKKYKSTIWQSDRGSSPGSDKYSRSTHSTNSKRVYFCQNVLLYFFHSHSTWRVFLEISKSSYFSKHNATFYPP